MYHLYKILDQQSDNTVITVKLLKDMIKLALSREVVDEYNEELKHRKRMDSMGDLG